MSEYQIYQPPGFDGVIRAVDQATIPNDDANFDWQEYQQWLTDGGVPDPYVEPPPSPPPPQNAVLFDHENRLREIEGQPPLPMADFLKAHGLA